MTEDMEIKLKMVGIDVIQGLEYRIIVMHKGRVVMNFCVRCGYKIKYGIEKVGYNRKDEAVNHRFGYCDGCMTKYDLEEEFCRREGRAPEPIAYHMKCCPKCKSPEYHAFVEQSIVHGKDKARYSLNLNPLRPFTLVNKKERRGDDIIVNKSRFVCDKCGFIFDKPKLI